ncbi:LysR family transcriptional regulator [Sneathiella glossodoripedis]|uniref:LysR family transcriptional regulator n=1 Tax=Sneathiella glossodoripedis TaxID=418853 RepID=UPI000471BD15|nr:LysR family transcriptional regulator [Sneathiella glossodoripedis]
MLDISDIIEVKTICEQGSISKAALRLNLSQPTLSKRISRLEDQLGSKLFYRAAKGLMPTQAAKYLIDASGSIFSEMKRIERHLKQISSGTMGSLSVAVGPIVEHLFLPRLLPELVNQTGDSMITVRTENLQILMKLLESSEVDAVIGPFGTEDIGDDYVGIPLANSRTITVAREGHPIFKKKSPLTREDLLAYPFAAPKLGGMQGQMGHRASSSDRKRVICENYPTLKSVVLGTDSISGGPEVLFSDDINAGRMRVVDGPTTYNWECSCIVRPEAMEEPLVKKLIEVLRSDKIDALKP